MRGSWDIHVAGFGPFDVPLDATLPYDRPRVAIYAGNGQGKTCLSHLLRAAEVGATSLSDSLVSMGLERGSLLFRATNEGEETNLLEVRKEWGKPASVNNQTPYIFHVFNDDYVRENLAERHYAPSGNIRGYLLGSDHIAIDERRALLQELGEAGRVQRHLVEQAVERTRRDLKALGISPRFREFAELDCEHILALEPGPDAYDDALATYAAQRGLPDDPALQLLAFLRDRTDFDELGSMLATRYTRDLFSETFLATAIERRGFIVDGLEQLRAEGKGDTCPFCGQHLGDEARALIHLYEDFLRGQEVLVVETLEAEEKVLGGLRSGYIEFSRTYEQRRRLFAERIASLGSCDAAPLPELPSIPDFSDAVATIAGQLHDKAADISVAYDTSAVDSLQELLARIDATVEQANERIDELNHDLRRASTILRETKRRLCREAARRVRNDCDKAISELVRLRERYGLVRGEIRQLEATGNQAKRSLVADLLDQLLREVFRGKYLLDRESFSVVFQGVSLGEDAEQVMSEGEKTALAFCHYVASAIAHLDAASDVERLFFVIDDPVMGLDREHALRVAEVLARLDRLMGASQVQLLVLSHDEDWIRSLREAGIVSTSCTLEDSELKDLWR